MTHTPLKYPCPCCGYLVFSEPLGSYEICPICCWEDDLSQLRFPTTLGANSITLIQAQENYASYGVSKAGRDCGARPPNEAETRDPEWRPINRSKDNFEKPIQGIDYSNNYPSDYTELYYWRQNLADDDAQLRT